MQDWCIQFQRQHAPTAEFVHQLLYCLVANGVQYNAGQYPGEYIIVPKKHENKIFEREEENENREHTERLGEIIETYRRFEPRGTSLRILLAYTETTSPIHFTMAVRPSDNSEHEIRLEVTSKEIKQTERFLSFVELCIIVFERLDLLWGRYRSEYDDFSPQPTTPDCHASVVNLYSDELAEMIGREKILSAPALRVTELNQEKIALVVCGDPYARCRDELMAVNRHLGFQ